MLVWLEYFFTKLLSLAPCSDVCRMLWVNFTSLSNLCRFLSVNSLYWTGTLKKAVMLYQYSLMACSVACWSTSQNFSI